MSKPSRDDRKKAARKKVLGAVYDPLASRLLECWQSVEASQHRLRARGANHPAGIGPSSDPEWLALAARASEREKRFEEVTASAIAAKNFGGTLSSLQRLVTKRGATPPSHQSLIKMRRMMGSARMNRQSLMETELGAVPARMAIIGIPISGRSAAAAGLAADPGLEAIVHSAGLDPENSSIAILGAVPIAETVSLSLDPALQWRMTDYLEKRQGAITEATRHQLPGGLSYLQASAEGPGCELGPMGTYVILVGIFRVGLTPEDECSIPAIDGLDEAHRAAWGAARDQLTGATGSAVSIGLPHCIAGAAHSAIGLQLLQALASEGAKAQIPSRIAFIKDESEARLLGQFADGAVTECPGLDKNALFLLEDVANGMGADVIDEAQRGAWLDRRG